jgi:hypothetical protein
MVEPLPAQGMDRCVACADEGNVHAAWLVNAAMPLCVRHAADTVFPHDDMRAHDMAHGLYLHPHAQGVRDAY